MPHSVPDPAVQLYAHRAMVFSIALLVLPLSGCVSDATRVRRDRQYAWNELSPTEKTGIIAKSCDEGLQDFTRYTITVGPTERTRQTIVIAPILSPREQSVQTKLDVEKTCRQLSDTALRSGTTHSAWCANVVPTLIPRGLAPAVAETNAITCYTATLRRLAETAQQRRGLCCADKLKIGSNGVWKCFETEVEKLDIQHADDKCKSALGGPGPFSAALWCSICADPDAFLNQLTKQSPQ